MSEATSGAAIPAHRSAHAGYALSDPEADRISTIGLPGFAERLPVAGIRVVRAGPRMP